MKRFTVVLLLFCLTNCAFAQTHELLRKSIGGIVEMPEPTGADFGLPSDWNETVPHLDSLVYIGAGKAVKVTGYYRKRSLKAAPLPLPVRTMVDTLYGHPLFSRPHALDSIRRALRSEQVEGLGETKYVGYDSVRVQTRPVSRVPQSKQAQAAAGKARKHSEVLAVADSGSDPEPPGPAPLFAGGTILFALLLCGGIARLYRQAVLPS